MKHFLSHKSLKIALAATVLAGGGLWLFLKNQSVRKSVIYETVAVEKGSIRRIVSTSGPVRALVTVSIGSQLSGPIEKVLVDFNKEVKPGDILASLDKRTFAANVAQAEANLSAAEAALMNQEAALVRVQAILRNSQRTIDRQQQLADKGFASQSALDNAIRDQEVAKAEIAVASAQIETAKATIIQRKAALEAAQIDLERTDIRSPISGTVISRSVDPGQTVASSFQAPELFKIAQDLSHIRIEAQVNEADVGGVEEKNPVTFTVDAYPDREFQGQVTQVRLSATEINNVVTYTVIIEASNEDRKLFPGMTANVRIETDLREGVLRVPNDALRFRPRDLDLTKPSKSESESRTERTIEKMKGELELNQEQVILLRKEIEAISSEARSSGQASGFSGATFDPNAFRQKLLMRFDQTILPLLTDEQRKLYDRWKKGREGLRIATLWVLGTNNTPERRIARIGLSDDQFTEIVGGEIKEGDKVILRIRESVK
ncbi:MAG: efflux RND transporter periplasmic adaptor subunit [Hyphomicrobium sp.]